MTTVIVVVLVVLLLFAALRLWLTANRLDRLHVRTEAAWSALEGALARRIVATRAVAAAGGLDHPQADELRRLADVADHADRAHRADAENDLSRALSTMPAASEPDLALELADASERVVLARRFYNDAVRDTRALRAVLFTRIFGLAGRAAMPDYFEIAEFPHRSGPLSRMAARVVLIDDTDRVLLLSGTDPGVGSRWWITPGGGVEGDETLPDAARRELAEETGLLLDTDELVGPIWRRKARFTFTGIDYEQTEFYFAARAPRSPNPGEPGADGARQSDVARYSDAARLSDGWLNPDGARQSDAGRNPDGERSPEDSPRNLADAAVDGAQTGATMVADPRVVAGQLMPDASGTDAALDTSGHTDLERRTLTGHRWWTAESLTGSTEMVYPVELAGRLPEVLAILSTRSAPSVIPDVD